MFIDECYINTINSIRESTKKEVKIKSVIYDKKNEDNEQVLRDKF